MGAVPRSLLPCVSVSPAKIDWRCDHQTTRPRKSLKVSHFLRFNKKKRRDSEEKFLLTPLVKSVAKRASKTESLEKCGFPLKHCT